jgi:hypothetical protein
VKRTGPGFGRAFYSRLRMGMEIDFATLSLPGNRESLESERNPITFNELKPSKPPKYPSKRFYSLGFLLVVHLNVLASSSFC